MIGNGISAIFLNPIAFFIIYVAGAYVDKGMSVRVCTCVCACVCQKENFSAMNISFPFIRCPESMLNVFVDRQNFDTTQSVVLRQWHQLHMKM